MARTLTQPRKDLVRVAKEIRPDEERDSTIPKDVLSRAYRKMSNRDRREERAMAHASGHPQAGELE